MRKAQGSGPLEHRGLGSGARVEFWPERATGRVQKAGAKEAWFRRRWDGADAAFGACLRVRWSLVRGKGGLGIRVGALRL